MATESQESPETDPGRADGDGKDFLGEQAYQKIRERILLCDLKPGATINGVGLAQEMGMSRTPVHEALKRLATQGYMRVRPRVGFEITPITVEDLQEIFQLRMNLEGLAVDLAMRKAAKEELEGLRGLAYPRSPLTGGSLRTARIDNNTAFHVRVAHLSGNLRLIQSITKLLWDSFRAMFLYVRPDETEGASTGRVPDHERIAEAMIAEKREAAIEAMGDHLANGLKQILEGMVSEAVPYDLNQKILVP